MEIPNYEPFYIESLDALRAEVERLGLKIPIRDDPSNLGDPLPCGGKTIPNRFCAQPISCNDAESNGAPGPLTLRRYQRFARGRFGLIWIESTAVTKPESGNRLWLCQETFAGFRNLVETIRVEAEQSPVIILQLTTLTDPEKLSDEEIASLSDATILAATLAAEAGFDGVDIQACHGALAGNLLAAFEREGHYGGTFENRTRFLRETISEVAQRSPDLLLASRLCAFDATRYPHGFGVDAEDYRMEDSGEPVRLVRELHKAGLNLLNVTSASPNRSGQADERPLRPLSDQDVPDEHPLTVFARQLRLSQTLREAAPGLPVVGSGFSWLRHFTPHVGAGAIAEGPIDFIGLGRGALACPDAPAHVLEGGAMAAARSCMVCFACSTMYNDGAVVGCVIRNPETYAAPYQNSRRFAPDRLVSEARRCHFCEAAPCIAACPTHTGIPSFIRAYLDGDEAKAYEIIRKSDPLPELTSHLSTGWLSEPGACVETALTGSPVPILDLQYALSWKARQRGETGVRLPDITTGKKVAIIGGGPAGIAAAARLLEYGHDVEVLESSEQLGGTPTQLIPSRRLPNTAPEIDALLAPALKNGRLQVQFQKRLGVDFDLEKLRANSDAVLLATGVWSESSLGNGGENVISGLAFLEEVKREDRTSVPTRVAILAGGDSAMDAASTAKGLGADEVFVVYGGPRSEMHWHMPESWFATPGVHAMMQCEPLGYETDSDGELTGLRIRLTEFGTESILSVGLAIEAMGLQLDQKVIAGTGIVLADSGLVSVDPEYRTTLKKIYAAGGIVNGGASVAHCVAEGLAAADSIHQDIP